MRCYHESIDNYSYNIPLNSLHLSNRAVKALEAANINTLAELLSLDICAINSVRGIGDKALGEIIDLRRIALIESRVSYDLNQLLIYVREQITELKELTDQEILFLDIIDILPIYKKPHYDLCLLEIARNVEQQLPYLGTPYSFFNILASIAHTEACRSISELIDYIFQDFSEIEKRVLLINYDGKRRTFAELGKKTGFSRERIRQIYQIAVKKFNSPYQRQRQSGFILMIISHQKDDFLIDLLHYHFRGRSKKRLAELLKLVSYHWLEPFRSEIRNYGEVLESLKQNDLKDELIEDLS